MLFIKQEAELKMQSLPESELVSKRTQTRQQSLSILEKNMTGCMRLMNLDLINDTAMLIFNTAIPFFKKSQRQNIIKSFFTAVEALETISSNETLLRTCLHFELAKAYSEKDLLQESNNQIKKALLLDYSSVNTIKLDIGGKDKKQLSNNQDEPVNINYINRPLEQYLNYYNKILSVKIDIYNEKESPIEILLDEEDKIKNAKYDSVRKDSLKRMIKVIREYKIPEFNETDFRLKTDKNYGKDLVEEELNEIKLLYKYKVYDEKKYFTLICSSYAKLALESAEYQICDEIHKIINIENRSECNWNSKYDIEQIIAQAEIYLSSAKCYEQYLTEESIEIGSNNIINYDDSEKQYNDLEINKFNEWKISILKNISKANYLAVSVQQYWLVFNIAVQLWNCYLPIIKSYNFVNIILENVIETMSEVFESLNSAMIYYESISSETTDNEYFTKVDLFINFSSFYAKVLEGKGRQDESIRVCDVILGRKLTSQSRKIFDQIKARAIKTSDGKKAKGAPIIQKKGVNTIVAPTQDQLVISDCYSTLELATLSLDEKSKAELLKKGFDVLKVYKVNLNDDLNLELIAELWYKYGAQFYSLKNYQYYKNAVYCSDSCVKPFDVIDIKTIKKLYNDNEIGVNLNKKSNYDDDPRYRVLKWYAAGYLLYGDSLSALVNPEKQERNSQIDLHFIIVKKYVRSCQIAEQCQEYNIILQSTKAFYNAIINMIDQPQSREKLLPYFNSIHKIFVSNRVPLLYSDPDFLLLFYSMYCQSIIEVKSWDLGEIIISEALRMLHPSKHHFLLEYKLLFYTKLNKSFIQQLNTVDDKDLISKSKLYIKLARSSENKEEQFSAFNKAIDILKNDKNILVVDYIVEYSSWLYKNNYPSVEVEANLLQASDLLLEIEPIFDEDENNLEDDGVTAITKRSGASRLSRLSKNSKIKSDKSKSKLTKNKSKVNSTKTRTYNAQSVKTNSIFSKMLLIDPYPVYCNISHLQVLFNIHVQLSQIVKEKEEEYLLDAFYFITKIIEISFKTLNCLEFFEKCKDDISKMNLDINNPVASLVDYYYTSKDLNITQVYSPPDSITDYLIYDFPEFFIKKISEFNHSSFFSKAAFSNPFLFLENLKIIIEKFNYEYYFHSNNILLNKVAMLFSSHILDQKLINETFYLSNLRLYHNIINVDTLRKEFPDLKDIIKDCNVIDLTNETITINREMLKKYDINLSQDEAFVKVYDKQNDIRSVSNWPIHVQWIFYSSELISFGYIDQAKVYLIESLFHTRVHKDKDNYIKASILLSIIHFIEGKISECFNLLNFLQSINTRVEVHQEIFNMIFYILLKVEKYQDITQFSDQALLVIDNFVNTDQTTKSKFKANLLLSKAISVMSNIKNKVENNTIVNAYFVFNTIVMTTLDQYNNIKTRENINEIFLLIKLVQTTIDVITEHQGFVYITQSELDLVVKMFDICCRYLTKVQGYLIDKQTLIPGKIDDSLLNLPIYRILALTKILFAQINNYIGEFKAKIKRIVRDNDSNRTSNLSINLDVIEYLNSLTKVLEQENNKPNSQENKNRYEKSISLLISIDMMIPDYISNYIKYFIERINSYRLQSMNSKELLQIWSWETLKKIQNNTQKQEDDKDNEIVDEFQPKDFHQKALNLIEFFKMEKISLLSANIDYSKKSVEEMIKYYFNVIELSGYYNIKKSLFGLIEYQNQIVKKYLFSVVDKYQLVTSKDWSHRTSYEYSRFLFQYNNNIISCLSLNKQINTGLDTLSRLPYYNYLSYNTQMTEDQLQPNSSYFSFQMNEDRTILFCSFFYVNSDKKINPNEIILKRILISNDINKQIDNCINSIKKMKHFLIKSVIVTMEDLKSNQEELSSQIKNSLHFIEDLFGSVLAEIDLIVNPEIKEEDNNNKDKNKKEIKKDTKKNKENNTIGNIPLPNSGIESLVLLIDYRFYDLPFEFVYPFKTIPVKSNDFSLSCYTQRTKNVTNEKISYFVDVPNSINENKAFTADPVKLLSKLNVINQKTNEIKCEGVISNQREPALGEIQRMLNNNFIFCSQTSFFYHFNTAEILDISKTTNRSKVIVMMDRLATIKEYVNQKSLIPKNYSFNTQPLDLLALFTLQGASSILTSKWSLDFNEAMEVFDNLSQEGTINLSLMVNKYRDKNEFKLELFKYGILLWGIGSSKL